MYHLEAPPVQSPVASAAAAYSGTCWRGSGRVALRSHHPRRAFELFLFYHNICSSNLLLYLRLPSPLIQSPAFRPAESSWPDEMNNQTGKQKVLHRRKRLDLMFLHALLLWRGRASVCVGACVIHPETVKLYSYFISWNNCLILQSCCWFANC